MSGLLHSAVALRICQPPHPTIPKQEFSVLQTASLLKTKHLCCTLAASATWRTFSVCGTLPPSVPLCGEKQVTMVWTCK
jgi:hypothetical protein